jgi:hypothetical protein
MTDYLSNLVARTLETAPVLQSRRPSLFEPIGGAWGMPHTERGIEETGVETVVSPQFEPVKLSPMQPVVANPGPQLAPIRPPAAMAAPPPTAVFHQPAATPPAPVPATPAKWELASPVQAPRPPENSVIANHTPVVEKTVVQKIRERQLEQPLATPPTVATPRALKAWQRDVRPEVAAVGQNVPVANPNLPQSESQFCPGPTGPTFAPPPAPPPPIKIILPTLERRPSAATPTKATMQEPPHPPRHAAPANKQPGALVQSPRPHIAPPVHVNGSCPIVVPLLSPRTNLFEQLTANREEAAVPAPTIHVHIGQIEVRATPPPPTAKKSRPQTTLTSLDDYLRERNRGAR